MRERDVERNLVRSVRSAGGLALKFISPGMAGVPDRLILLPGGRIAFCEVKAPGQKPRPLQAHRMEQLRRLGFRVYVIDSVMDVNQLLREMTEVVRGRSDSPGEKQKRTGSALKSETSPSGQFHKGDTGITRSSEGGSSWF